MIWMEQQSETYLALINTVTSSIIDFRTLIRLSILTGESFNNQVWVHFLCRTPSQKNEHQTKVYFCIHLISITSLPISNWSGFFSLFIAIYGLKSIIIAQYSTIALKIQSLSHNLKCWISTRDFSDVYFYFSFVDIYFSLSWKEPL